MTALTPARVGWCPGALRPMQTGDGLVVRVKPTGGRLTLSTAARLARLASSHGSGDLDLTARSNLQIRGVSEASHPLLLESLTNLGLVDADAEAEAVRNIVASPFAGLDDRTPSDVRPILDALDVMLANDTTLRQLPAKWSFVLDDGGPVSLSDIAADVRFEASTPDRVLVGLADDPVRGICRPEAVPSVAAKLCRVALASGPHRMAVCVERLGVDAIMASAGLESARVAGARHPGAAQSIVGSHWYGSSVVYGVAAPFGSLQVKDLLATLDAAQATGATEIRLTPWRVLLIPLPSAEAAATMATRLVSTGLITDARDPRLAVSACTGAPHCRRGSTPVRTDATYLARVAKRLSASTGVVLHVSGCAKGCAHPAKASLTLVGRDGLYDVVVDGRADGQPSVYGLDLTTALSRIDALCETARP